MRGLCLGRSGLTVGVLDQLDLHIMVSQIALESPAVCARHSNTREYSDLGARRQRAGGARGLSPARRTYAVRRRTSALGGAPPMPSFPPHTPLSAPLAPPPAAAPRRRF